MSHKFFAIVIAILIAVTAVLSALPAQVAYATEPFEDNVPIPDGCYLHEYISYGEDSNVVAGGTGYYELGGLCGVALWINGDTEWSTFYEQHLNVGLMFDSSSMSWVVDDYNSGTDWESVVFNALDGKTVRAVAILDHDTIAGPPTGPFNQQATATPTVTPTSPGSTPQVTESPTPTFSAPPPIFLIRAFIPLAFNKWGTCFEGCVSPPHP